MSSSSAAVEELACEHPADGLHAGHLASAPAFAGARDAGPGDGGLEGADGPSCPEREQDHRHDEGGTALDERRDRGRPSDQIGAA